MLEKIHKWRHVIFVNSGAKLSFSASAADMIHFAEATLLVYSDGAVLSVPPASFDSLCRLGMALLFSNFFWIPSLFFQG